MLVTRCDKNPLITPSLVKPSRPDFKVEGTFNAGVIDRGGETLMLVRIAESVAGNDPDELRVPVMVLQGEDCVLTTRGFNRHDSTYDFSDPRTVVLRADPSRIFLTSLSHIRLARSGNGVDFKVDDQPFLFPENRYELFGCEDAR